MSKKTKCPHCGRTFDATHEVLATIGRAGGLKGGKAAAANMTPEQRSERARKAVAAREAKRASVQTPDKPLQSARKRQTPHRD